MSYGTGAVMAVPAHDERDYEFAKKYGLPIPVVIAPPDWQGEELAEAYVQAGTMVNSGRFNNLPSEQGIEAVNDYLEEMGWGKRAVSYRLRDWLISRQRYWGAPIPIIYCRQCGIVPVPEEDLPVLLPEDAAFKPTGESPLKYNDEFVHTTCPRCLGEAERETDTMDTFMCSSWYFLRYASPNINTNPFDDRAKYWLPVDLYTGGAEHAVMHLLYARFFSKAIRDMGLVAFDEPFTRLFNQGVIIVDRQKMSKSKGNVVNPDSYVSELGADAVRAYLMFVAPWEQGGEWNDSGISGVGRWLKKVWHLVLDGYVAKEDLSLEEVRKREKELMRVTHQTIRRVTDQFERIRFNTMISSLMELTNYLVKVKSAGDVGSSVWDNAIEILMLLMAPTAPHMTEELWQRTSHKYSIHNQQWPYWNEELAKDEKITMVIQVNGKLRDRLLVPVTVNEQEVKQMAMLQPKVEAYLANKKIVKVVYVPGRLINFVVG